MPGGPLAHICLLVRDLDQAVADWTAILAELDPGQLVEPVVVDHWEAGGDVMSSATFVNPVGPRLWNLFTEVFFQMHGARAVIHEWVSPSWFSAAR